MEFVGHEEGAAALAVATVKRGAGDIPPPRAPGGNQAGNLGTHTSTASAAHELV
jgi:hypothetical protein